MKISIQKKERIFEQILNYLYECSPKSVFTSHIAREIARDEEFIKKLLLDLKLKKFILSISKNPKGIEYKKRIRWKLSPEIYQIYKQKQRV
jgi:hypothetical protein